MTPGADALPTCCFGNDVGFYGQKLLRVVDQSCGLGQVSTRKRRITHSNRHDLDGSGAQKFCGGARKRTPPDEYQPQRRLSRHSSSHLEPALLKGVAGDGLFFVGQLEQRESHGTANLSEQFLPVLLM